ncbi:MAG TPA: VapC toxin family PIN domain ribonuclease [Flavobacterium sp.]|nr:VapC toxin family PIN domain ribonuclease [Flavobacterium sp.]HAT75603.1 VapC toxin family PIN domain ribonuclease [Flavobacterium sp.]HAT81407.1 VapC toxin family PIN domain ribonuclease [Flavobacterium sp.]
MYLLDTNIIIFSFRGNKKVNEKISVVGFKNCYISEITIAELHCGAEKSNNKAYNINLLNEFLKKVTVIPIKDVIDCFAFERVRLEKIGNKLDNFDLLIGATAIVNNLVLVTNNTKHFDRMSLKSIEDWTN